MASLAASLKGLGKGKAKAKAKDKGKGKERAPPSEPEETVDRPVKERVQYGIQNLHRPGTPFDNGGARNYDFDWKLMPEDQGIVSYFRLKIVHSTFSKMPPFTGEETIAISDTVIYFLEYNRNPAASPNHVMGIPENPISQLQGSNKKVLYFDVGLTFFQVLNTEVAVNFSFIVPRGKDRHLEFRATTSRLSIAARPDLERNLLILQQISEGDPVFLPEPPTSAPGGPPRPERPTGWQIEKTRRQLERSRMPEIANSAEKPPIVGTRRTNTLGAQNKEPRPATLRMKSDKKDGRKHLSFVPEEV
jgi:hypothetical protein